MAYHITKFVNDSKLESVTANPKSDRDTYFVKPGTLEQPKHPPLLNKGEFDSYSQAFPIANWIYTGTEAYAFWDSGKSEIFAVTQKDPRVVKVLYQGSAGDLTLTINVNGAIEFKSAK